MSPRIFQLHLYSFRLQIALRKILRAGRKQLGLAVSQILPGLRWMGQVVLVPLWIFFVLAIALWARLELRTNGRYLLRTWHRGLYCVGLSLGIGLALAVVNRWGIHPFTLLLSGGLGLWLFLAWKRGARWLGKLLGVRPVRSRNPKDPYAGLDLGN